MAPHRPRGAPHWQPASPPPAQEAPHSNGHGQEYAEMGCTGTPGARARSAGPQHLLSRAVAIARFFAFQERSSGFDYIDYMPGWVAQSPVASDTSSYLADGVLERAALVAAWRPTLHSDDHVAFVYRVMQEFGLFLPLSGDGGGLRISDLPERTLVPSMLRNEEPKGGEAWSRAAVHARRFGASERSFTFKLKKASGGGGGGGGVATAQAPVTLHGLLHGFVVRVAGWCDESGASDWSTSPAESAFWALEWRSVHRLVHVPRCPSAFWALGWRSVHRLSGVRARVAMDDLLLSSGNLSGRVRRKGTVQSPTLVIATRAHTAAHRRHRDRRPVAHAVPSPPRTRTRASGSSTPPQRGRSNRQVCAGPPLMAAPTAQSRGSDAGAELRDRALQLRALRRPRRRSRAVGRRRGPQPHARAPRRRHRGCPADGTRRGRGDARLCVEVVQQKPSNAALEAHRLRRGGGRSHATVRVPPPYPQARTSMSSRFRPARSATQRTRTRVCARNAGVYLARSCAAIHTATARARAQCAREGSARVRAALTLRCLCGVALRHRRGGDAGTQPR